MYYRAINYVLINFYNVSQVKVSEPKVAKSLEFAIDEQKFSKNYVF